MMKKYEWMANPSHMRLAIEKAKEGVDAGQTPFGACVVKDGEVIGLAHNNVWSRNDITAHAEICAIEEACNNVGSVDLSGSMIYATTEPCPMCFSAIHWAKISIIVFGTKIGEAKEAGFNELEISNRKMKEMGDSQIVIIGDFLADECREVFDIWLEKDNKKSY